MLIVLHPDVSREAQAVIEGRVRELGFTPHAISGAGRTAIGITGNKGPIDPGHFRELPGVADCIPVTAPYKLVSREVKHEDTVVDVAGVPIGGPELVVMAGPCAVESEQQILTAARGVAASGASLLRGGAFKPRTSPYDFQGLKQAGLDLLSKARSETGLKIVTEVKDTETLPAVVDPSHGIGIRSAVLPMARAAVACGADGLIIEVHPDPDRALSDGMQSLNLASFEKLMREVEKIAAAMGRSLHRVARA